MLKRAQLFTVPHSLDVSNSFPFPYFWPCYVLCLGRSPSHVFLLTIYQNIRDLHKIPSTLTGGRSLPRLPTDWSNVPSPNVPICYVPYCSISHTVCLNLDLHICIPVSTPGQGARRGTVFSPELWNNSVVTYSIFIDSKDRSDQYSQREWEKPWTKAKRKIHLKDGELTRTFMKWNSDVNLD